MSLDISKDILRARDALARQPNGTQVIEYMRQNNYADQTPLATSFLKKDMNKTIIISNDVQKQLEYINKQTKIRGEEVPYFLTGTKLEDGLIRFDSIMVSYGEWERQVTNFNKEIVEKLNQYVKENRDNSNAVICHGHTHPPYGNFYNEFSIADLGAYVNLKNNRNFGEIDTIGMVLVNGNYNFVDYDGNQFQALPKVVREVEENKKYEVLPSYSHEKKQEYNIDKEKNWDDYFNDVVEQCKFNKPLIRKAMLDKAYDLNKKIDEYIKMGLISPEDAMMIISKFNRAFNQAFADFGLPGLTRKDIENLYANNAQNNNSKKF